MGAFIAVGMLLFPLEGAGECCPIPPMEDMCLSLTNYWPWDENGDIYSGWNGQCNEDCSVMSSGYRLPAREEDYVGDYAACIHDWTSLAGYPTIHIDIHGSTNELVCVDGFGKESYRKPFFHPKYMMHVIPVDMLREIPVGGVWCDWSVRWSIPMNVTR